MIRPPAMFEKEKRLRPKEGTLHRLRPFLTAAALFGLTHGFFAQIAEVSQDSARHVLNTKRAWALEGDYIQAEEGKRLVFFMGDSKIAGGLIPKLFDGETGTTRSYNAALPGLPLAPHYYWLKDYLRRHDTKDHPDYILLSLKKAGWDFFHFSDYSLQHSSFPEIMEYTQITGNNELWIHYFLPMRADWPLIRRYFAGKLYSLSPALIKNEIKESYEKRQEGRETYAHDWEYNFNVRFVHPEKRYMERLAYLRESRGFYDFREASASGGVLPDDYVYVKKGDWGELSNEMEDPFIEKFFELTRRYGIKVILINDYVLESQAKIEGIQAPSYWKELARRYEHVSMPPEAAQKQIYENRYFSDPLHLTVEGAGVFTKYTAGIFKRIPGTGFRSNL